MKERPILFSGPMVRAIIEGRKTVTRRIFKFRKPTDHLLAAMPNGEILTRCPYGQPGDRLWVREQLRGDGEPGAKRYGIVRYGVDGEMVLPCATCGVVQCRCEGGPSCRVDVAWEWERTILPSIHMPRWASRLTLEVTGVRVERLQDISEEDARAEGVEPLTGVGADQRIACDLEQGRDRMQASHPHTLAFACLWDEINLDRASWASNPWVWAVSFKVAEVRHG